MPHSEVGTFGLQTNGRRVVFSDFRRLREPHPVLALVPQWDLLNLLAEAAKAEPTFTLRMQTEVTGLLYDGERIAGVRYQGPDGPGELRAELTVACDGRTSTVRSEAGMVPQEFPVPFDVAWFRLDAKSDIKYELAPRISDKLMLILIPAKATSRPAPFCRRAANRNCTPEAWTHSVPKSPPLSRRPRSTP